MKPKIFLLLLVLMRAIVCPGGEDNPSPRRLAIAIGMQSKRQRGNHLHCEIRG